MFIGYREITLSRRVERASSSNFKLIGSSSLLAAAGSAAAWFNHLTTVLVSKIPLLLAKLSYISAMTTHDTYNHNITPDGVNPHPQSKHVNLSLSCRPPKARPHHKRA